MAGYNCKRSFLNLWSLLLTQLNNLYDTKTFYFSLSLRLSQDLRTQFGLWRIDQVGGNMHSVAQV